MSSLLVDINFAIELMKCLLWMKNQRQWERHKKKYSTVYFVYRSYLVVVTKNSMGHI